jgi:hypothetical protein
MLIIEVIFVFVFEQVYRKAAGMTMSLLADFYSLEEADHQQHVSSIMVALTVFCSLLDG